MRILFVGSVDGTSTVGARAGALERLGHTVVCIDPRRALPSGRPIDWWCFHTAGYGVEKLVERHVRSRAGQVDYDLVFVDVGELVSKSLVLHLKSIAGAVICYNQDNPFTSRDGGRWRLLKEALPLYDVFAVPRDSSVARARQHGARNVVRIWHPADELLCIPIELSEHESRRFSSEVAFVGTWMPERGPFIRRLIDLGVPVRVFGPRWHKAIEYTAISPHVTLGPLFGDDYVKAIAGSKIGLVLLSKGNEDLHTTRSTEIPAIGRLLCGERTSDHMSMYHEDVEAIFWSTPEECAAKCKGLLADPARIERIAAAGQRRAHLNKTFNQPQLKTILDAAVKVVLGRHGI